MSMSTSPERIDARRAERRRADAPSTLRGADTGPLDTIVLDISQTGARVECRAELVLGDFVSIGIAGVGSMRAIVVWRRGQQYGLDFVVALTAAEMERAFAGGTVVSLTPPPTSIVRGEDYSEESEEVGVYAEASGWLSALLAIVVLVTAFAVAILRGWIF